MRLRQSGSRRCGPAARLRSQSVPQVRPEFQAEVLNFCSECVDFILTFVPNVLLEHRDSVISEAETSCTVLVLRYASPEEVLPEFG